MTDSTTLRMERTFQAPAEAVFDAWTSEGVMRRWWHAEHDWETTEAQVDLRVGGTVRVVMRNPHEDMEYGGGGDVRQVLDAFIEEERRFRGLADRGRRLVERELTRGSLTEDRLRWLHETHGLPRELVLALVERLESPRD